VNDTRPQNEKGPSGVEAPTEDLLELAQEAGRLGIFEWQIEQGRVRLSAKCLALYGLTEFDGRYESWLACIFREDVPRVLDAVDRAFQSRDAELRTDFRMVRRADKRMIWMEARNAILYGAGGAPTRMVGVHVDVSDRKRAAIQLQSFADTLEERVRERTRELEAENEARKRAEESLRQAQKMEAVGQLTGGVAHDFNNLLTVILGGLQRIGRQLPGLESSPAVQRIERARSMALQGVERAVTLTRRLLAFSRQQPLNPAPVDANKLLTSICEILRRTIGEAISLETVFAGGLWQAFADPNQLENAILNLALNARDAMPDGGKLTIETANCHLDEAYASSVTEPVSTGHYVLIAVTDTGGGMDKVTQERAFEPFFTTKEIGKGTGLGLSQVYGFVRQSSGHVRIYSELGEGTTVKIYLPRHADGPAAIEEANFRVDVARAIGMESILVVEDEPTLRNHTVEMLRELGYRVTEASNAVAALEILDRGEHFDLMFTDVVMPGGINGRQLAEEVIRRRPGMKVLFTTGYTRNAIVHHGRLDPGVQLLNKPFSFEELGAAIRKVLDWERD